MCSLKKNALTVNKPRSYPDTRGEGPEADLIELLRQFVAELHPGTLAAGLHPGSRLQDDLGIDSLARTELLSRIEERFRIRLRDQEIIAAETVDDLVLAIQSAQRAAARPEHGAVPEARPVSGAPAPSTPEFAETLIDVLEWRERLEPERVCAQFLADDGRIVPLRTRDLLERSRQVAAGLRGLELPARPVVAIMLPTCLEFFYCFYGILMAGGIPVPLYPPDRPARLEEHMRRQIKILANCQASLLIAPLEARPFRHILKPMLPHLGGLAQPEDLLGSGREFEPIALNAQDIAFLQYTSGSTGDPKGVVLNHSNLLANIRTMGNAIHADPSDLFVSWLPLYHDMGLIGACMGTLYFGTGFVLMSPLSFIARPERWLWAIHEHRATLSSAPNFAYELCSRKLQDSQLAGLDLSSWRVAFNGAEPVSASTLLRFAERFKPYGFRAEALTPVYGLAECTVGLTFPPLGRGPMIERVRRDPLIKDERAMKALESDSTAVSMVSCGAPLPKHELRIVDGSDRELGEREVGRIQFRGPSATSGYFRNPSASRSLFHGDWLDTGDYGYLANGEVFVTGRAKDLIIRGGRHIFPYELEEAIGSLPEIRRGGVAVFGRGDPLIGTEEIIVLAETRRPADHANSDLGQKVRQMVLDAIGVPPDDILLAPPRSVPKTPSGKIRRSECLRLYEQGKLGKTQAVWKQWLRLRASAIPLGSRRVLARIREFFYGPYFWLSAGLLSPLVALGIILLPRLEWRISFTRALLRLLLHVTRTNVQVLGLEHAKPDRAKVIVPNHASYADWLILSATLPGTFHFVAKKELARSPILHWLLRRLGCLFVERFDPKSAMEDSAAIVEYLRKGQSVILFPEGTFTRAPGLRSFRMGAFWSAALTRTPLLPVTLEGTRFILREGHWLPHRRLIRTFISPPIEPRASDWAEAIRLRDLVRTEMLRHCGEPDLGQ